MKRTDYAIISPAWTHSYENRSDFRRSSPGHRDRFRAHRSHTSDCSRPAPRAAEARAVGRPPHKISEKTLTMPIHKAIVQAM